MRFLAISLVIFALAPFAFADDGAPEGECRYCGATTYGWRPELKTGRATYKVVGWFDENDRFQARGYVFEQPHSAQQVAGEQTLTFTLGDTRAPLVEYLVRIDEIEQRTGVDFFPMLQDTIEDLIEAVQPQDVWGAQ